MYQLTVLVSSVIILFSFLFCCDFVLFPFSLLIICKSWSLGVFVLLYYRYIGVGYNFQKKCIKFNVTFYSGKVPSIACHEFHHYSKAYANMLFCKTQIQMHLVDQIQILLIRKHFFAFYNLTQAVTTVINTVSSVIILFSFVVILFFFHLVF